VPTIETVKCQRGWAGSCYDLDTGYWVDSPWYRVRLRIGTKRVGYIEFPDLETMMDFRRIVGDKVGILPPNPTSSKWRVGRL